ncbi:MAG: hypothetical protein K2K55_08740 [Duncaniella sp.]|nr:hypothetical protein [Duncaniella sp.]
MQFISQNEFFLWLAIAAMVLMVSLTGMYINRFMMYRAHRRALDELRRRALERSVPVASPCLSPCERN